MLCEAKFRLAHGLANVNATIFACSCVNARKGTNLTRLRLFGPNSFPFAVQKFGRFAARAMREWLGHSEQPFSDRACAYDLLPAAAEEGASLEIACGNIVKEAYSADVDGKPVLLTEDGTLTLEKQSIIIPNTLFQVWEPRVAASMLDETGRPPLCQNVSTLNRKKLVAWGFAEEIDKQKFLTILQQRHLQKPESWTQLLNLWAFVAPELTG